MPNKSCVVCKRLQTYSTHDMKLIDRTFHVCSWNCIMSWLEKGRPAYQEVFAGLELKEATGAFQSWSELIGMFFRSDYERVVAEFFRKAEIDFKYERYGFLIRPGKPYTPDFYLPEFGSFVEVKGRWGTGQKKKMKEFRSTFPGVRLVVAHWMMRREFGYV